MTCDGNQREKIESKTPKKIFKNKTFKERDILVSTHLYHHRFSDNSPHETFQFTLSIRFISFLHIYLSIYLYNTQHRMSLKIYWERITNKHSIAAKDALNVLFSKIAKPDIIGRFEIVKLSLGSKAPEFQIISISDPDPNILVPMSNNSIEARVKFSYDGDAFFQLEVELLVNAPTPKFIVFPISVKVSSPHLNAIASVIYDEDNVCFCLIPEDGDPLKDLEVEAMVGDAEQHVLMDLDKLISFVKEELREIIQQYLVYPNRITVPIKMD
ncbi:hypothetical protein DFA_08625 [Cavenderia fasciculata]|uniref:SMP-LTD domain-containing protein n=1 Tax=Cavenderia fasciculata TaxID=261658 RepID=F4Q3B9_CACFS|nr:uncharacterized protein DFA_08625 [Cavenderia fasciculata]EGG17629.1 hypothetical protein DFA_08625 [Cavenderia fasciculata]|eukprot:XP_004356113.1 hypothetical protein DFA_08625 [Cavenderia fasciculata]